MSINASYQKQFELAESREKEAINNLHIEKENCHQLITKLKNDIRDALLQHQELLEIHDAEAKQEIDELKNLHKSDIYKYEELVKQIQENFQKIQETTKLEHKTKTEKLYSIIEEMNDHLEQYKLQSEETHKQILLKERNDYLQLIQEHKENNNILQNSYNELRQQHEIAIHQGTYVTSKEKNILIGLGIGLSVVFIIMNYSSFLVFFLKMFWFLF